MRIISGTFKGKRLQAPKHLPVRPTTDMAKEGLFNILNNRYYFDELKVLDLFSGTGNIAYEFASRGSIDITAVDAHFGCVKYIENTSKELEFQINAIKIDVFTYLEKTSDRFDLIFADPPYNNDFVPIIFNFLTNNKLFKKGSLIVIEESIDQKLTPNEGFEQIDIKVYGKTQVLFFEVI